VADRKVHYEAAFEDLLRARGVPYVAVDEAKRALFSTAKLKSFDYVVYSKNGPNLLVDVKGRSLRNRTKRTGFETWATEQDVTDLMQWEQVFGEGFKAVFGFTYWIDPPLLHETTGGEPGIHSFRDRWYLMMGVELCEYREVMRRRSEKWTTVCLKAEDFRSLARPIERWL